jgi:hypothetical protein
MHTKINKHPIAPNILTHVLWSKTILGKQQAHLELPLILHKWETIHIKIFTT